MWFCDLRQTPSLWECAYELASGVPRWFRDRSRSIRHVWAGLARTAENARPAGRRPRAPARGPSRPGG